MGTTTYSCLSRDEWTQIFLFLPLRDLCQLSLVHSTFYKSIMNGRALLDDDDVLFEHIHKKDKDQDHGHDDHYHSSLWCQLVKRDFTADCLNQNRNSQKNGSEYVVACSCQCRELRLYQSLYRKFFHFVGLEHVPNSRHFGEEEPHESFKVLFAVANYFA